MAAGGGWAAGRAADAVAIGAGCGLSGGANTRISRDKPTNPIAIAAAP